MNTVLRIFTRDLHCQHFVYDEVRRDAKWFFTVPSLFFIREIWEFLSKKEQNEKSNNFPSRITQNRCAQHQFLGSGLSDRPRWNEAMHLSPDAVNSAARTREKTQGPAWENREWEEKKKWEVRFRTRNGTQDKSSLKTDGGPDSRSPKRYAIVLTASSSKSPVRY